MQQLTDSIVRLYFDTHDLVQHQLDSYNTFLNYGISQILTSFPIIKIEHLSSNTTHCFQFIDARVERPRIDNETILLPQEARLRNLTYDGNLYCTVRYSVYGGTTGTHKTEKKRYESKKTEDEELNQVYDPDQDVNLVKLHSEQFENVLLCRIPIMVKSNKCHLSDCHNIFFPRQDPVHLQKRSLLPRSVDNDSVDDYRVINKNQVTKGDMPKDEQVLCKKNPVGIEPAYLRVETLKKEFLDRLYHGGFFIIKGQEKVVLIQERMRYMHACITTAPKNSKFAKYSHMSEIRSVHESKMKASSTLKMYLSKPSKDGLTCVYVDVPYLKSEFIPLPWLFRLMGVTSAQEMESYLLENTSLVGNSSETTNQHKVRLEKSYTAVVKKMCRDFSTAKYEESFDLKSDDVNSFGITDAIKTNENNNEWINSSVIYNFYEKIGPKQLHYLSIHEVLPHIGLDDTETTRHRKLIHLGQQARDLLLLSVKGVSIDNREHLIHKRMETTGLLMSLLFRQLVWPECKQIKTVWHKELERHFKTLTAVAIENGHSADLLRFDRDKYEKLRSAQVLQEKVPKMPGQQELQALDQDSSEQMDIETVDHHSLQRYIDLFLLPDHITAGNKNKRDSAVLTIPSLFLRMGITESLRYALATGNWGKNKGASNSQQGISQPLNRNSPMATYSHLRRTSVPISKDGKLLEPRQLHTSHWGMICPAETPEGKSCGLIKNLALFAQVNSGIAQSKLQNILDTFAVEELSLELISDSSSANDIDKHVQQRKTRNALVYLNGTPVYWMPIEHEQHLHQNVAMLRELRRRGIIPYYVSIYTEKRFWSTTVHLNCYAGSMIRPVFNTEKLAILVGQIYSNKFDENDKNSIFDRVMIKHFRQLIQPNTEQCQGNKETISRTRVSWTRWSNMCSNHVAHMCWNYLLRTGIVQYLDKNEETEYQIATNCQTLERKDTSTAPVASATSANNISNVNNGTSQQTQLPTTQRFKQPYVELVEWGIWGVMASFIVLLEHNQAVRNIFQCSHGKAAVGISSMNLRQAVHAIHHQLWYPQAPLVDTDSERFIGTTQLPSGANAVVAVMLFDGYNPEDAIVVSKAAIERGLFRSTLFHTYPFEENKNERSLQFQKNPKTIELERQLRKSKHHVLKPQEKIAINSDRHLDVDGLPIPGNMMKYNDKIFEQVDTRTLPSIDGIKTNALNSIKTKSVLYKGKGSHQHLAQAHSIKRIVDDDDGGTQRIRKKLLHREFNDIDFDSNEAASRIDKVIVTNTFQPLRPSYAMNNNIGPGAATSSLTTLTKQECINQHEVTESATECQRPRSTFVRLSIMRVAQVGDKLSSRHGQKGVIARVVRQEDMPWSREGIVPDIIINAHYMPSRMTVAQTLEQLMSKQACLDGKIRNGSAFVNRDQRLAKMSMPLNAAEWRRCMAEQGLDDNETLDFLQDVENSLLSEGYSPSGTERLYRGDTGQAIEACIFMGVVNYQRLTHQGTDKIHARARGPTVAIVRQPTDRRSKDGGQRVGEMEKDCLISYGANMITKDRLMDCSDFTPICVCRKCGMIIASASLGSIEERFALKNNRWSKYYDDLNLDFNTIMNSNTPPNSQISKIKMKLIENPDQDRRIQLAKICAFQNKLHTIRCHMCPDATDADVRLVALPQALCCLLNEMMGMNICPKLILD